MVDEQGVESLFFDLASESRRGILIELRNAKLKMNELSRKLDLTPTETSRQLQRLSEAHLISKQSEGEYTLTEYGKLILQVSPTLEVAYKYREYFLTRNLWRIPPEFLYRIGELSQSTLILNVADSLNYAERIIKNAEYYIWSIGDKSLNSVAPLMLDRYSQGVKEFKLMMAENLITSDGPSKGRVGVEERSLWEIPAMIVCSEKEAAVCLLSVDGRADYMGFFGADPTFRKWTNDLFIHFWGNGKKVFHQ